MHNKLKILKNNYSLVLKVLFFKGLIYGNDNLINNKIKK